MDGIASLAIAALLVGVAYGLGRQNQQYLIGKAASPELREASPRRSAGTEGVDSVLELMTMRLSPEQVLVAARVDLADHLSPEGIERAADEIERPGPRAATRRCATCSSTRPPTALRSPLVSVGGVTPEETARRSAETMWADDRASQALGMSLDAVDPGPPPLSLTLRDDMVNGHGIGHGGSPSPWPTARSRSPATPTTAPRSPRRPRSASGDRPGSATGSSPRPPSVTGRP